MHASTCRKGPRCNRGRPSVQPNQIQHVWHHIISIMPIGVSVVVDGDGDGDAAANDSHRTHRLSAALRSYACYHTMTGGGDDWPLLLVKSASTIFILRMMMWPESICHSYWPEARRLLFWCCCGTHALRRT